MATPSVVGIGRDLGRAFRERPALVVGAAVLALIGLSLLNRGRGRDNGAAAEGEVVDPLAGLFPGVGTWGGSIPGSGSVPFPGYPSAGDGSYVDPGYYVDPGPIAPTPAYTPPSYTPTPAPSPSAPAPTSSAPRDGQPDPTGQTVADLAGNVISWAAYQAERLGLINRSDPNAPYSTINRQLVDKYGGTIYPGQGPEENLTNRQYAELVLGQFPGNTDVLSSPNVSYSRQAWYDYLVRVGPAGYVGVNSGQRDDREYYSNLEIAKINAATERAGIAEGSYGYPGSTPPMPAPAPIVAPRPVVDLARIAALQAAIATNQRYISNLLADTTRTAAQNASLQAARDRLASQQRELAGLQAVRAF